MFKLNNDINRIVGIINFLAGMSMLIYCLFNRYNIDIPSLIMLVGGSLMGIIIGSNIILQRGIIENNSELDNYKSMEGSQNE